MSNPTDDDGDDEAGLQLNKGDAAIILRKNGDIELAIPKPDEGDDQALIEPDGPELRALAMMIALDDEALMGALLQRARQIASTRPG